MTMSALPVDMTLEKQYAVRIRRMELNVDLVYEMVKELCKRRMPKEMLADFERRHEEISNDNGADDAKGVDSGNG